MAKYRKIITVDAAPYQLGMEDGFVCYSIDISGKRQCFGYFDKNSSLPKCNRYPAIRTLEGHYEISEDDYILVGINGERWICKKEVFLKTYELVEE